MIKPLSLVAASILLSFPLILPAQQATSWKVRPEWVKADEDFLASDAMQGRGSGTHDEEVAATYVASRFESFDLKPAPGISGYLQEAELEQPTLDGHAQLTMGGTPLSEGTDFYLLRSSGTSVSGPLQKIAMADLQSTQLKKGAVILLTGASNASLLRAAFGAAQAGAELIIVEDNEAIRTVFRNIFNGKTNVPITLKDGPEGFRNAFSVAVVDPKAATEFEKAADGSPVVLTVHTLPSPRRTTHNAIGMLAGSDPAAGTILISAHLDHLGIGKPVNGDDIYNGADDDASGTTAVLELAHALAAGPKPRRNVLFVCYGSEELGGLGSTYFALHPPVPLNQIITNLEFEMIGVQDPRLPKNTLLLTGWERSNLGPTLRAHGAKLAPDPYPEEHLFQRSDNYSLALKGVVAHTAGAWPTVPYYHRPNDDLQHLNVKFMTEAIQSLVEPVRWLATSNFKPAWNPGGQPHQ